MLSAKFGCNWVIGSGAKDFLMSSTYLHHIAMFSTWKRLWPFTWISFALTGRYYVLSLDEIGPVFLEEKIFICSQHIFTISPLQVIDLTGKCCGPWASLMLITERLLIDLYCLFMAFTCYYLKIQQYIFSFILYLNPLPGGWYCDAKWKTCILKLYLTSSLISSQCLRSSRIT